MIDDPLVNDFHSPPPMQKLIQSFPTPSLSLQRAAWALAPESCPELPPRPRFIVVVVARLLHGAFPPDSEEVHGDTRCHERYYEERLQWLRKDGSRQQKETDAAENDWGCYPRPVWPLQSRLLYAKHNEGEHRQEVEGVAGHAVECQQRVEFAHEDVGRRQRAVQDQRIDRCEKEPRVFIAQQARQRTRKPTASSDAGHMPVFRSRPGSDSPKEGRDEALLAGCVNKATAGKGGAIERAEAGRTDDQG